MSWNIILPFLRPLEPYLKDPELSEIMVNGNGSVFIERNGVIERVPNVALPEKALQVAVKNIARTLGDDISEEQPILDARLPDGSRVAAMFPPCSVGGTTLTIRKFDNRRFTPEDLVRIGMLTPAALDVLRDAVLSKQNMLVSGGTGTGKTTLLNALASLIPVEERIVVIEETSEIYLDRANVVRFEARRAQGSLPAVTLRDLLRATLRHRPDRILLGEVRGGEAFDLLQLMNTGHAGTLFTIHANSAEQALNRFAACALQSKVEMPYSALRIECGQVLHVLVHLERRGTQRLVTAVVRLMAYDFSTDRYGLELLFSP